MQLMMRIILEYPCHESITIITVITIIKSICRVVKMQSLKLTYQFILSISVVTHWSQQENERRYSYNLIDHKITTIFMFLIMLLILWQFFLYHFKIFYLFVIYGILVEKRLEKHHNYLFGLHHNRNIEYLCTKQYTAMCFRTYNWNPRTK
jgi:predicted membrane protein